MARYRVAFHAYVSATVYVDAEDEEAAVEAAYDNLPSGVCAQCSGWNEDWSLDLGDFEVDDDEEFNGYVYKAIELVED